MEELEYQLNDPGDKPKSDRNKRQMKTIICIFTSFIIILVIFFIISIFYAISLKNNTENLKSEKYKLENDIKSLKNETNQLKEQNQFLLKYVKNVGFDFNLFGEKLSNLSYAKNKIIENSF